MQDRITSKRNKTPSRIVGSIAFTQMKAYIAKEKLYTTMLSRNVPLILKIFSFLFLYVKTSVVENVVQRTTLTKDSLLNTMDYLTERNFHGCKGVHFETLPQPQDSEDVYMLSRNIPKAKFTLSSSTVPLSSWDKLLKDNREIARKGKQCIVYEIVLHGITKNEAVVNLFLNSRAQERSKISFIIIQEFKNFQVATDTLMNQKLASFPFRLWPSITFLNGDKKHPNSKNIDMGSSSEMPVSIWLHRYHPYIKDGLPGIDELEVPSTLEIHEELFSLDKMFPDYTKNLNGATLKITAPPAPPLVLITPSKATPQKYTIQGQQKIILESIASKYNFSYDLYPVPGGSTGRKLENGTWVGVMGEILNGNADIGLSVAIAYERRNIADFTVPVFYAFLVLVSTKPIPILEWQAIFYPFTVTAWLAFVVSTVVTIYLYKFLHNSSVKYTMQAKQKNNEDDNSKMMRPFSAVYMALGSMLEQGVTKDFETIPSRIMATFWMFFAIIITCAYRSKLFSFLISPTLEIPPSSFEELSVSKYEWGMKSLGGVAYLFITQSPIQYIRDIGEEMETYTDKYTCLDKTFFSRFTCIIYKAYIDYMMEVRYWKIRHKFHVSDFVTPPVGSSWSLRKYSPLLETFDKMSFRIFEMGLADKYLYDYQVAYANKARILAQVSNSSEDIFPLNLEYREDERGPKALRIDNLYGCFTILAFGLLISFVCFCLERAKHQKLTRRQKEIWAKIRWRFTVETQQNKNLPPMPKFSRVIKAVLPNVSELSAINKKLNQKT